MSERSARAQLAEVQEQLAGLTAERDKLAGKVQSRNDELATQRAVNQQLMLKKEEVEWQLMAAIAKVRIREETKGDLQAAEQCDQQGT
jgi:maltodextrin utilization protein YvdJ